MATVCPPLDFGGKYYTLTDGVCVRESSYFGGKAILNQGVGYAVVLGFGAFFALFTSFLVSTLFLLRIFALQPLSFLIFEFSIAVKTIELG